MNSLSARIALLLVVVFMLLALALVLAAQVESWNERLTSVGALVAVIGLALLGAWCALQPLLRRIGRLADALESLGRDAGAAKLRIDGADPHGDDLARLAAQAERVSEQLAGQARALARASRQRTELLANVSHDLRTPLASMQGYLELLLVRHGSLTPAEVQGYLQTAARQSERLSGLVADLFELTRLEAEDMRPQTEAFALADLAQDVLQKYTADARRRDVTLHTRCDAAAKPAGALRVMADIGLIERLLDNLVDNALRHTPAGGAVTIEIEPTGSRVQVAVLDTGVGIAAEDMPGIFERYEHANRVGDVGAGIHVGLGLAIARRIVQLHGSPLQVHSEPGRGTQVRFELTLAEGRCSAATDVAGPPPVSHQPRQRSA
jgi:signal transduction histidine kinase